MSTPAYVCRKCHAIRKPSEVVALTHLRSGQRTYLCRPMSLDWHCFANDAYARGEERVSAVDDDGRGDA